MIINILLFDDFETLDVFGPVEMFGTLSDEYALNYISKDGGPVKSHHGAWILTDSLDSFKEDGILFIPGGFGTRPLVDDPDYVSTVRDLCDKSKYCLTVCTGSALLGKTGLLKGLRATSNKIALEWVMSLDPDVKWLKSSRWAADGKYWSSSGVSAGMDMAIGFIQEKNGREKALQVCQFTEYIWNENMDEDPFSMT